MTSLPAGIAADAAITKQNAILSTIKSAAEADQAIADILEESSRSASVNASLGSNVNISV